MTIPLPIDVRNLTKTYGRGRKRAVHALGGVDMTVRPGEIVGILGPNGAGKTTLLKIVLGIVSPTSGNARLFGRPSREAGARKGVGYLPENHRFPLHLTAFQTMDIYGRLAQIDQETRKRRIPQLLERMGLADRQHSRVRTYSKGMMQRLGVAQALLSSPTLLILDEPTDGVDPIGRRDIRDVIQELREEGTSVLINSHLLSEIELVCDRVAIMNRGLIVREGSVAELTATRGAWRIMVQGHVDAPPGVEADHGSGGTRLFLSGSRPEEMNALLDRLRQEGHIILSVEPVRRSLEAGFIETMEGFHSRTPASS